MAQFKACYQCGEIKETIHFSKKTKSADGLQNKCKACNKVDNLKFRTEKPKYQLDWQKENYDKVLKIVRKYRRADKNGLIYYIKNPEGKFYVGMTKTRFKVRMIEHKTKWRRSKEGKLNARIPLLWESFDKWGFENHETGIILELPNIDRETLKKYETECIESFQKIGISLNLKK